MTVDDACRILTVASTGNLATDDEFREACRMGVEAMRKLDSMKEAE